MRNGIVVDWERGSSPYQQPYVVARWRGHLDGEALVRLGDHHGDRDTDRGFFTLVTATDVVDGEEVVVSCTCHRRTRALRLFGRLLPE